ncbi:glycerophosphodiester phosphodiesterase [Xanthomonas melonis]|uniref:glycerophosphodiester phosphodiesterase n=1 Tax=Xanthomonas melonis TaxID=56456 RepID=A0A2S7DCG5_9XANT|nr:glycerophosphodiester phosphodiesterase [Xanthomonas melonis]MCC4602031.1 glycerophosphodiester phosphodiesterase [Xanthomonas melonis]PPU71503.1 glycerophosphodiester phosphodiesterase [Xanthomonas melonis]
MMRFDCLWLVGAIMVGMSGPVVAEAPLAKTVQIFAHRGASALRPEHTLAAYAKAIVDGADFVEPDLVSTKDGVLIARHENEIGGTTDVANHPEFAARKTRKRIDGQSMEGWFTEDFSLAELKTLRARERLPQLRGTRWDGHFQIVTLDEIIDFVAAQSAATGRSIGLIPEIKHPSYFRALGLPMEDKVLATVHAHTYTRTAPVIIQSFETNNLRYLRSKIGRSSNIGLLQLLGGAQTPLPDAGVGAAPQTYGQMITPEGLKQIAGYADAIGPDTRSIIPLDAQQRLARPTTLVRDAHAAGLQVQPYTFRPENYFLAADNRDGGAPTERNEAGALAELRRYLDTGIDALFADDPGLARRALSAPASR